MSRSKTTKPDILEATPTTALALPSRRLFLSHAAGLAAGGTALALATVTPMPAAAQGALDTELVQAAHDLQAIDQTISDLFDKHGDDTDSRADFRALERQRGDAIATLATVPALSAAGVKAKATVLRLNRLIEANDEHQQVAVSLADDIAERGLPLRPVGERLPDPVFAAIEAHEKAYVACRAACAESSRLYELADKVAGKSEVTIPDLRVPGAPDEPWGLPVAYEQDGQKYVVARTIGFINQYLPGEENEQLRQSFAKKLDEINKARAAVEGDNVDDIVSGPATAEANAVDDLIEVVPTTAAGLLALLTYLAKARRRDPDVFYEQHLEPLIATLGKAAAILS